MEIGFGRAVSRILSALLRAERIICLSDRYPKPVRFRGRGAGSSSVSNLALHPMGFSVPCRLRFTRCAFTAPFHPYQNSLRNLGGLIFCGTVRRQVFQLTACVYPAHTSTGYAASRPVEFGLSSPDLRPERFSTLPKPVLILHSKTKKARRFLAFVPSGLIKIYSAAVKIMSRA